MQAAARTGMRPRIACPPEHVPIAEIAAATAALAHAHGGSIERFDDPREAVAGARAIYTTAGPRAARRPPFGSTSRCCAAPAQMRG